MQKELNRQWPSRGTDLWTNSCVGSNIFFDFSNDVKLPIVETESELNQSLLYSSKKWPVSVIPSLGSKHDLSTSSTKIYKKIK